MEERYLSGILGLDGLIYGCISTLCQYSWDNPAPRKIIWVPGFMLFMTTSSKRSTQVKSKPPPNEQILLYLIAYSPTPMTPILALNQRMNGWLLLILRDAGNMKWTTKIKQLIRMELLLKMLRTISLIIGYHARMTLLFRGLLMIHLLRMEPLILR